MKAVMNILIVEDEDNVGSEMKKGLELLHHKCIWVKTEADAKDAMRDSLGLDVALVDLRLPKAREGYEVLKYACENRPSLCCVVLTGALLEFKDVVEAVELGVMDYLRKPFPPEEAEKALQNALERRNRQVLPFMGLAHQTGPRISCAGALLTSAIDEVKKSRETGSSDLSKIEEYLEDSYDHLAQLAGLIERFTRLQEIGASGWQRGDPHDEAARAIEIVKDFRKVTPFPQDTLAFLLKLLDDVVNDEVHWTCREGADPVREAADAIEFLRKSRELRFGYSGKKRDPLRIKNELPRGKRIRAEGLWLREVLLVMIQNAADALEKTGKGGLVRIYCQDEPEGWVRICVADNGPGISPEHEKDVFHYGFTTKGARGMGVGLAFAREIVERSGGKIGFTRLEPQGTEFWVRLQGGDDKGVAQGDSEEKGSDHQRSS